MMEKKGGKNATTSKTVFNFEEDDDIQTVPQNTDQKVGISGPGRRGRPPAAGSGKKLTEEEMYDEEDDLSEMD